MTDLGLLLRDAIATLFQHTYSRTPISQGAEDTWGETADTAGTPATGLPCVLVWEDRYAVDAGGPRTVRVPTLYVLHSDTLAVGDRVSAVVDASGTTIAAGPLVVETIDPAAGLGSSACKIAVLRGAVAAE